MIEQTVAELTPMVGTSAGVQGVGCGAGDDLPAAAPANAETAEAAAAAGEGALGR